MKRTLIVASGPLDVPQLEEYLLWADQVIACDGGQDHLESLQKKADLLIGDFDSIRSHHTGDIRYSAEKDFSDLEAALEIAVQNSTEVVILGATGGRLDHFISAVMLLFGYKKDIRIVDVQNMIFTRTAAFDLPKRQYPYFSLLPLDDTIVTIYGAKYPLQSVLLKPYHSVGLSNEWEEDVRVEFEQGRLIVVLSTDNKKTP